ncbi:hypothetical protein F2Q68_00017167 [Brassica cretica]|uniref:RING-type domain-containing protein n=1 Tax=Brassica cretica TaxID=69181 RepID=A0A8S9HFE3_BRACR|nr:hypothetical protein F2Q68_00017167 [Brassica cretica]
MEDSIVKENEWLDVSPGKTSRSPLKFGQVSIFTKSRFDVLSPVEDGEIWGRVNEEEELLEAEEFDEESEEKEEMVIPRQSLPRDSKMNHMYLREEVGYSDDEAFARAIQEAEEREMADRLSALTGLANRVEDPEEDDHTSQDAWDEMDPDELSYEELLALGDIVGTESRGLSADTIASLPSKRYKDGDNQNGTNESCVICRLDYEDDDDLILLPCKHSYHSECINNWLKINKHATISSTFLGVRNTSQLVEIGLLSKTNNPKLTHYSSELPGMQRRSFNFHSWTKLMRAKEEVLLSSVSAFAII